jgi:hypothetical protein
VTRRRLLSIAAAGAAATTLVIAGCGDSADTAATNVASAVESTATGAVAGARAIEATCMGAEEACSATIGIGGGASNTPVRIELTGTDMGEPTITPSSPDLDGAYEVSDAKFTTGGSIYAFTLNAVDSIPEGATLTFEFARTP